MVWKAVCHCSTGVWHQKNNLTCQDYGEYRLLGKVIIGAVADGAGSAKYSHLGAELAVKGMLTYLEKLEPKLSLQSSQLTANLTQKIFVEGVQEVKINLQKQASQKNCSFNELACTLIAFIATPHWITAMQIGDGFLITRLYDSQSYQLFFRPDRGEFVNETTFITSKNALDTMQVDTLVGNHQFICASTDGLENVSMNLRNWLPFTPFFQPLEAYLKQTNNPEQDKQYLIQFLESERLQSRTDDDKTLLLCFHQFS